LPSCTTAAAALCPLWTPITVFAFIGFLRWLCCGTGVLRPRFPCAGSQSTTRFKSRRHTRCRRDGSIRSDWCTDFGLEKLPQRFADVADFVVGQGGEEGKRQATIRGILCIPERSQRR